MNCSHRPVLRLHVYVCPLQQVSFNNGAAETRSFRRDVDKWAITAAIFTCPICGRRDPRLASLMLDAGCESCACQYGRPWRRRGSFWHVIHHRFHSAATAVSPPPLTDRWPDRGRTSRMIKHLCGIRDSHPAPLTGQGTKTPFPIHPAPQWHLYQ